MCGISGAISFLAITNKHKDYVQAANNSLHHRGPDENGIFASKKVVLGHTRLSIVGLNSSVSQPMSFLGVTITFNGEIYNYKELREVLRENYRFITETDSEVILAAYHKWGIDCLKMFKGMFALAIFDSKLDKLYLCRDRLGKKPLYWCQDAEKSYFFCSEVHPFFSSNIVKKKINQEAVYHYLSFLTVPSPSTFFEGVYKVKAGCFLEIEQAGITEYCYWDVADFINKVNGEVSFESAVLETKEQLEKAMRYRSIADVPLSVALSGGLDSSLNVFYAKKNRSDDVTAINLAYSESSKFDESKIAEQYAKEVSSDFESMKIDELGFQQWIKDYLNKLTDIPLGDPNTALMYVISSRARELGKKVLFVGEGGDEIGGYSIYTSLEKLHKFVKFIPQFLFRLALKLPLSLKLKKEIDIIMHGVEARRFIFGFSEFEKKIFWRGDKRFNSYRDIEIISKQIKTKSKDSFFRRVLNVEYKLRLAELILPRVDYPTMLASVEARCPFMDHEFVEYSSQLPFSLKMQKGPKTLIKEVAKKMLPEYVLSHPKVGFGMLLTPFLKKTMPKWFKKEVLDGPSILKNYVSEEFLWILYSQHQKSKKEGYRLWILFALHKWLSVNFNAEE